MRGLAMELAPHNITANCIAPGSIATAANAERRRDGRWAEYILEHTLLPRTGEPEDIANAAVWLVSDFADYVTGTTLFVDGGMTLYPGFADNG